MTPIEQRLVEDRAMRDAAKALFNADVAQVRNDLASRGIGERIGNRASEAAMDMADEALELAGENKGVLGAGLAALLVWVFRAPLMIWLFGDDDDSESERDREASERG